MPCVLYEVWDNRPNVRQKTGLNQKRFVAMTVMIFLGEVVSSLECGAVGYACG